MMDMHIDQRVLRDLQDVMEGGYQQLLEIFLEDSERRLSQLHATRNASELRMAAHSFKGSSSNMGAVGLAALCQQLEDRVKQMPAYGVEDLVNRIDSEYRQVKCFYLLECERVSGS